MQFIAHRRNTLAELDATPTHHGVEIDLRSREDELILRHDPFQPGERFEDWLAGYRHGTLILNVKEEGLEDRVLALLGRRRLSDFFFLDQSFPFLVRSARRGERRCAVRVSELESVDTALALRGLVDWVWVDCFTRFPLDGAQARALGAAGFKLCLVSPELQGRTGPGEIADLRALMDREGIVADAVCGKLPGPWGA